MYWKCSYWSKGQKYNIWIDCAIPKFSLLLSSLLLVSFWLYLSLTTYYMVYMMSFEEDWPPAPKQYCPAICIHVLVLHLCLTGCGSLARAKNNLCITGWNHHLKSKISNILFIRSIKNEVIDLSSSSKKKI